MKALMPCLKPNTVLKEWPEKKKYESAASIRDRIVAGSYCHLVSDGFYAWDGACVPGYFEIRLHGEAAKIPASKNRRIPISGNRSIPNHKTTGHMWALDSLFQAAMLVWKAERVLKTPFPAYTALPLFVLVISCKRSAACDMDNILVSVRDWLEPSLKAKGGKNARGWGIGLVDDDKNITGMIVPSKLAGMEVDYTRIIIRPLEMVRGELLNFLAQVHI